MRADPATTADTEGFAARSLLWLQLLTLAVGALQFAFVPAAVEYPLLAAAALALLTISLLLARTIPALRRPISRQHALDVAALIVSITLLAASTGIARSPLLPLYVIPLAGIAIAWGRWWLVLLTTALLAALAFVLGVFTPGVVIGDLAFGVEILSVLTPGAAVALIIAAL